MKENIEGKKRKYNILFISTDFNYFIDDNASFNRMYNNLIYFQKLKDFDVIVLQPKRQRHLESPKLKKDIKCYYFRELSILNNKFIPFTDFNPFYILKIYSIIKKHKIDLIHVDFVFGINCLRFITKIPISYNAHNVETIYYKEIGIYYYKLPFFLRKIYTNYIYLLEKYAVKLVKNINAISLSDKLFFIKIFNIPQKKLTVSPIGFKKEIFFDPVEKNEARKKFNIENDKFIVIFHGSYYANQANKDAIDIIREKIIPKVKDEQISFLIAGKIPPMENKTNLRYLGYVRNLKSFLYSADIAIVPILRGSGVRTKIIDYLSAKLPIITTEKGVEGLFLKNEIHCYIVKNSIEDIIDKILILKNNPNLIKIFKNNVEKLLFKKYKWEVILKRVALVYKKIIES